MQKARVSIAVALVLGCSTGCGGGTTKIGGITSVQPTCVGLVKATGFCFSPPAGTPELRLGECVRVTYTSKNYPVDVKVSKIATLDPARHRDRCPT